MSKRLGAPYPAGAESLLESVRRWAEPRQDVRALLVVGSVARGDARPESDIDVIVLTTNPTAYRQRTEWVLACGDATIGALEHYGRVTSVRVFYDNGPEVEFSIAEPAWASAPFDSGTEEVARNGIAVLFDRDGEASALEVALGPNRAAAADAARAPRG